ncbi:hypothetical protein [Mesorhizobium caraganae]|uniref:hypothetical protein n=1 Tax=Mesorhizobium caraganae TaxID=483206 RepID=UPI003ECCDCF6
MVPDTVLSLFIYVILGAAMLVAVAGVFQRYNYKRRSTHWPTVKATVTKRILLGSDPPDYALEVRYEFKGKNFTSVARDNFHIASDNRGIGDELLVKVDPDRNSICYIDN